MLVLEAGLGAHVPGEIGWPITLAWRASPLTSIALRASARSLTSSGRTPSRYAARTHKPNEYNQVILRRIAELFGVEPSTISYHLKEIYAAGELTREATLRKLLRVQREGNRDVRREIELYNLDAIISVGYRVSSAQATQFRIWATQTLREFIVKGFVLDDERLKLNKRYGAEQAALGRDA